MAILFACPCRGDRVAAAGDGAVAVGYRCAGRSHTVGHTDHRRSRHRPGHRYQSRTAAAGFDGGSGAQCRQLPDPADADPDGAGHFGTAIASRRQRRAATWTGDGLAPEGPSQAGATESLARAAEVGLAEIGDLSREPREAIIACYAAMERELSHVPGAAPLDCDTPSEVLARAVNRHALNADSATQLVELFEEARFSPHVMNEGHRDAAVDALRLVLADLRSMA
jgi:hypothetical protein